MWQKIMCSTLIEHIKKTINRITNECYNTIMKQIKMREIRWLTQKQIDRHMMKPAEKY